MNSITATDHIQEYSMEQSMEMDEMATHRFGQQQFMADKIQTYHQEMEFGRIAPELE
jgi:hypothetical protein